MTDEADSSVVLAELQVALFRECNNQRLSPWGRPFYICIPYLKILAYTVPEKTVAQISHKRQKNGQIKGRIRARSPILDRTVQDLIVHVYTKFQHSSFKNS